MEVPLLCGLTEAGQNKASWLPSHRLAAAKRKGPQQNRSLLDPRRSQLAPSSTPCPDTHKADVHLQP